MWMTVMLAERFTRLNPITMYQKVRVRIASFIVQDSSVPANRRLRPESGWASGFDLGPCRRQVAGPYPPAACG